MLTKGGRMLIKTIFRGLYLTGCLDMQGLAIGFVLLRVEALAEEGKI